MPQDRIIPFLGGGSLLRSSTLDDYVGVLVALGGAPVELIVATDVSLQFLQMTDEPRFLFRVREKIALRIKEADSIVRLYVPRPTVATVARDASQTSARAAAAVRNVIITGQNLLGATQVGFGQAVVTGFSVDSDTQITLRPPPGNPGARVDVTVTTLGGTSPAIQFTY